MDPVPAETSPTLSVPTRRSPRQGLLGLSALLCLVSGWTLTTQPDAWAWLMIFPRWTWLLCGLALWGLGFSRSRLNWSLAVLLLWGVQTAFTVEEARSLLRSATVWWPAPRTKTQGIRVCTFNCGSGEAAAIEEALSQQPDLVLFQESPPREVIERVARRKWGDAAAVAWGPDAVIAARGGLTLRRRSPAGVWIWATWHRGEEGGDVEVISLRLHPVPLRFDFWNRECWRALTTLRQTHRNELAELLEALGTLPADHPCILGGDFNAPAHDASLAGLRPNFRDAFDEAGTGWGNTIVNGMPVQRIDQVWINAAFRATSVRAATSQHSDHALVLCDLALEPLLTRPDISKTAESNNAVNPAGTQQEHGIPAEKRP